MIAQIKLSIKSQYGVQWDWEIAVTELDTTAFLITAGAADKAQGLA